VRLIRRRTDYDRKWLLAEAEKARIRGRRRRAISLYRRILAAEPHDPTLHARVAPLLAAAGKRFDAWQSYRQAAQVHLKNQNKEESLALYRDATKTLPMQIEACLDRDAVGPRPSHCFAKREASMHGVSISCSIWRDCSGVPGSHQKRSGSSTSSPRKPAVGICESCAARNGESNPV